MAINRIHTVTNRVTKKIKYFGSRPQAYRFLLEQQDRKPDPFGADESDVWELSQVLEYEFKYQLVILINDIFKNGYEGGMDFLSSGEMMGIINESRNRDRFDSGRSEEFVCAGREDDRVHDDALRRMG